MSSFKSRTDGQSRTPNYRFTVDSLDDPAIAELKIDMKRANEEARDRFNHIVERFGIEHDAAKMKTQRWVRIRPRGSRITEDGKHEYYDTPIENATHFDVYVARKIKYRGYDY